VVLCGRWTSAEQCACREVRVRDARRGLRWATESWSVVNQATSVDITRRLTFDGAVTGLSASRIVLQDMLKWCAQPAEVTLGEGLFTTTVPASTTAVLSIHTYVTTNIPTTVSSLSRSVIGASTSPPKALTSTAAGPQNSTHTIALKQSHIPR